MPGTVGSLGGGRLGALSLVRNAAAVLWTPRNLHAAVSHPRVERRLEEHPADRGSRL
ncbi:hypothetical protein [Streptomyces goshikiensis]|uniref:hypothetical protein n=1 Tax=Streptomyces goshikiensis TaxID=1942 RepID=UPI0036DD876E